MTRTLVFALSALLVCAGLSQAQSDSGYGNYQSLINSRYTPPDSRSRSGSMDRHVPQLSMSGEARDPAYAPLASLERIFVDTLGRKPSPQEAAYWMRRLNYQSREDVAMELKQRQPLRWLGTYDPRFGLDYDPGPGSAFFPDPASLNFRDPSGPYFKSPYFSNYQYRRPLRAFPLGDQG